MPTPHLPSPAVRRVLRKLGANIHEAWVHRRLPMSVVAERASTSRPTISRLEKGDPSVRIGIYAAVLQALGLLDDLAALADPARDIVGQQLMSAGGVRLFHSSMTKDGSLRPIIFLSNLHSG